MPASFYFANEADLHDMWIGVKKLEKIDKEGDIIEGDPFTVTQWAKDIGCPWKLADKVEEIRAIVGRMAFSIVQIARSPNSMAD